MPSRTANLRSSNNDYDWLGDCAYFWENDPKRAMSYVREKMRRENDERKPAVIGAIIDLGFCMTSWTGRRSLNSNPPTTI